MQASFTEPPRLWLQVAGLSVMLALLFAVLQPPPTAHLAFPLALLAWLLHIGLGMLCALTAARILFRRAPSWQRWPWSGLLIAGVLGAMLFSPLALGLEALFPPAPAELDEDGPALAGGLVGAIVEEFLALLPSYLAAWVLVNVAPMLRIGQAQPLAGPAPAVPPSSSPIGPTPLPSGSATSPVLAGPGAGATADGAPATGDPPRSDPEPAATVAEEGLLDRLPTAVGRRLVSISADLHYLLVVTRRGRATLLGSLTEAERELGECGVRIHRSHWVALDAVRRLRRSTQGWRCELVDGRSLPVSRRRAADIKRRLGTDFVVED